MPGPSGGGCRACLPGAIGRPRKKPPEGGRLAQGQRLPLLLRWQGLPLLPAVGLALHLGVVPVGDGLAHLQRNVGQTLVKRSDLLLHGASPQQPVPVYQRC